MSDDTILPFGFPAVGHKKLIGAVNGGRITADGGVVLIGTGERRLGIATKLARLIADPRNPAVVIHSVDDILRAGILAIACGYADADDLDHLRTDPAFKPACNRLPDSGGNLCSQPTVSGWENAPNRHERVRMTYAMIDLYCASYAPPPAAVTLDLDDTPDVVHGYQPLCRSMSTTRRQRGRWRCCCGQARRHPARRCVALFVAWYAASASIGPPGA